MECTIAINGFILSARTCEALLLSQDAALLRAELFSIKQLERHAVIMAGQHSIDPRPGPDKLLPRLADNARVLMAAHNVVTAAALPGQRIAPAEAWLLDNYYLNRALGAL